MEATFDSHLRNSCFSHLDSKGCQYAIDSSGTLKKIRKKFRKHVANSIDVSQVIIPKPKCKTLLTIMNLITIGS